MARKPEVRVRRVYAVLSPQNGTRVLVDRIWPRGLTKSRARRVVQRGRTVDGAAQMV
jgi:uncharacterized protein YeaO (DUF488 family)